MFFSAFVGCGCSSVGECLPNICKVLGLSHLHTLRVGKTERERRRGEKGRQGRGGGEGERRRGGGEDWEDGSLDEALAMQS